MSRPPLRGRHCLQSVCALLSLGCVGNVFAQQKGKIVGVIEKVESAIENDDFFLAESLLKQNPKSFSNSEPRHLLLRALVAKGMYQLDEAENLLKDALRRNEKYGDALFEMALLLMERKNWKDAEVLLSIAADSPQLSVRRQASLPYYQGVVLFESGRIFDSKNSFLRLGWTQALDPAFEQSSKAYLSRVARVRPWGFVTPISYQYESNLLGLPDGAALPQSYSQRSGSKLITGVFYSLGGLWGAKQAEGPFGIGTRVMSIVNLPRSFRTIDVLLLEQEFNWSRFLGERWGMLRLATLANSVNLGGKWVTSSVVLKTSILETELSTGFEMDLQKSASNDRSVSLIRGMRDFTLWTGGKWAVNLPAEGGLRLPKDKSNLVETRLDVSAAPSLSFTPHRRVSLKWAEKLSYDRVSSQAAASYGLFRLNSGLNVSFTFQPYLVLSSGVSYETETNTLTEAKVKKTSASVSFLGLF
jgi:tetratricopeptide (TPR) repeat protein